MTANQCGELKSEKTHSAFEKIKTLFLWDTAWLRNEETHAARSKHCNQFQ